MKTTHKAMTARALVFLLGFSAAAWSQTSIPIENAGFEDPALDSGETDPNPPGWANHGNPLFAGAFRPTTSDYPTGVPESLNVATISADEDGDGLSQILTDPDAVLKMEAEYTLRVEVGNPSGFDFEGYRVQLLAGGELLAEDMNTMSPAEGEFELVTVTYTYDPAHEVLLGEPLEIRLLSTADAGGATNFDDVQLTVEFVENLNPPVIISKSPEHEATGVGIGNSIVATFDQPLVLGTGDIVIKDLEDDSTTQTIPVTDSSQVTLANNVLTINPVDPLAGGTQYAVLIPNSAAENNSEVQIEGISDDSEWTFTTSNLASQLGILDLEANDGINPATGEPWKAADKFRLVFITSEKVDPQSGPEMNDIATWNAAVQDIANAANDEGTTGPDLSSVTWNIIGSSADVDARDNTSTNPNVYGTGHGIFNMKGLVIHNNFNDLWAGIEPVNRPEWTENITNMDDEPNSLPWSLTGTFWNGTADGSNYLKQTSGSGPQIRQGRNVEGSAAGWVYAWRTGANWRSRNASSVYGMSEPLFVIDLDDVTPPEFVSIADDVEGGPVALDDEPVITYTVTFNEAMLPSTVDASDFGNFGTAGFTIDSVVQQEDAAVFLVTVTPTSAGTLQLQINESAVLTDLNGNPLDTSTALLDDTVIEITATAAGYAAWADGFPGLTNPDPTLDFDGGGLATALEWVLDGDPTDPSDDLSIMPTIDNTSDLNGKLLFTFRRNIDAHEDEDTTIIVEYSTDLVEWEDAIHQGEDPEHITYSIVPDGFGQGIDEVTVALPPTLAEDGKLFVRLNVLVESATE